jgi:MFS family permease
MATSVYVASIPGIMEEFHVGLTLAISPITFYAMGFVIGPLLTSALSEEFGRQYIYKSSLILLLMFTIVGGSAKTFRTLAVARAISGVVASPCVSIFAGVMIDVWKVSEEKTGASLFALYAIAGVVATEIGPISGEAIVADRGWRWSFWLTAMLIGICLLAILFIPETYEPEIRRQALKLPRKGLGQSLKTAIVRPIHMALVEPILLPMAGITTISQVVLFIFYAAYPLILQRAYAFTNFSVGLSFLPLLIGSLLALPILSIQEKRREKAKERVPEQVLPAGVLAAILMPASLFWYG